MTDQPRILVTGATGTVGRELLAQLTDSGTAARALVRNPGSANLPDGVELLGGDLSDPASLAAALDGVDAVFLVWPFTSPESVTDLAPSTVTLVAENNRRIVYLSAEAAADQPESTWARLERIIEQAAAQWTILRPTGFAKNTLMWAPQIRTGDVVRWPYAAAARSLIHEADIAAVAIRALTENRHHGTTYVLTGPQALTHAEQVRTIGEATGRPLRFEEIPRATARPGLIAGFGDEAFADLALDAWESFTTRAERVTTTVEEITGSPARTLHDWAADHADGFR